MYCIQSYIIFRKPGLNKRYKQSVKSYSKESLIVQHSKNIEKLLYGIDFQYH